jgi:glutamine synthetase
MPKPRTENAGSGMHLNLSLHKDGKNVFRDDTDPNGISREAYYFMGGLMKHIQAVTCLTNPTVNSYKRLVPGFEAPVYLGWSASTRNPLLRIPPVRGEHARIELRSPDSSSNPYLAFAVLLAAGLDGIRNQIQPPEGIDRDIQFMTDAERTKLQIEKLPANLGEAVRKLEQDIFIQEVLGQKLASDIIAARKKEYQDYCMQVTDWEIANYLYKV